MNIVRHPAFALALSLAATAACSGSNTTTVKPRTASAPPAQLVAGEGYRRIYPTFATQSVIAASAVSEAGNGKLEYLLKGSPNVVLSERAEPFGVQVAPAEPGSALFLDEPTRESVGRLTVVDLSSRVVTARALERGENVPVEGFYYGADGRQILFIGGYEAVTRTGALIWSDGTTSKEIALAAEPTTVLFSASRSLAVAAAKIDVSSGTGALIAVNMQTGDSVELTTNAVVHGYERDVAFALSGDGSTVAFTDAEGVLRKVPTTGGDAVAIAPAGTAPALSSDGKAVVFNAGDTLYLAGGAEPVFLAETPATVRPQFSPDNQWVTYFKQMTFRGSGAGAVGDAYLVSASAKSPAIRLGANVGWDSLVFNPASSRVSAVADLTAPDGSATYDGVGNLLVAKPGKAMQRISVGTQPRSVAYLEQSNSIAYIGAMERGVPVASLFVTNSEGTESKKLAEKVVPGTLRVARGFDSIIYIGEPEDAILEGVYRIGTLYGTTPAGPPVKLENAESGVIQAVFGRDGRAVVVVAEGEKAGVWTLPTP
jgi:hypothetical protein